MAEAVTLLERWCARHITKDPLPQPVPKWVDALLLVLDAALQAPPSKPAPASAANAATAGVGAAATAAAAATGPDAAAAPAPAGGDAAQQVSILGVFARGLTGFFSAHCLSQELVCLSWMSMLLTPTSAHLSVYSRLHEVVVVKHLQLFTACLDDTVITHCYADHNSLVLALEIATYTTI